MTEIIFTSALTVIGGVLIFVTGQLVEKFFVEPYHEYKILVGKIASSLVFYANVGPVLGDKELLDEAVKTFRGHASDLMAVTNAIPFYRLLAKLKLLPSYKEIVKASASLIGISNSVHSDSPTRDKVKEVIQSLNIKILAEKYGY